MQKQFILVINKEAYPFARWIIQPDGTYEESTTKAWLSPGKYLAEQIPNPVSVGDGNFIVIPGMSHGVVLGVAEASIRQWEDGKSSVPWAKLEEVTA